MGRVQGIKPSLELLTDREWDCLCLVYERLTSKAIAVQLGISYRTVDAYLDAAREKLGAATRLEAARIAVAGYPDRPRNPYRSGPGSYPILGDNQPFDRNPRRSWSKEDSDGASDAGAGEPGRAADAGHRRGRGGGSVRSLLPADAEEDLAPQITWPEIERQLTFLSGGRNRSCWEVDVLRKETARQNPEFFLQRFLILAWAIIDDAPDTAHAMEAGMT